MRRERNNERNDAVNSDTNQVSDGPMVQLMMIAYLTQNV